MLPIWDQWGARHAVTVLQVDDCKIVSIKKEETHGYNSVQVTVGEAKYKNVKGCIKGIYAKQGILPGNTHIHIVYHALISLPLTLN